jgi:hypothetical protein
MRRTARLPLPLLLITLVLLLITLVLAGCTQPDPMPTPPPTPSAAPVFASDEEALAAAEEAYGKYLAAADEVIRGGGSHPELVEPYLSAELYERDRQSFAQFAENGWFGVGAASFEMQLQGYNAETVTTYVCDDFSQTDVLNRDGQSVVAPGRQIRVPNEVEFSIADDLRIVRKELWNGDGVC